MLSCPLFHMLLADRNVDQHVSLGVRSRRVLLESRRRVVNLAIGLEAPLAKDVLIRLSDAGHRTCEDCVGVRGDFSNDEAIRDCLDRHDRHARDVIDADSVNCREADAIMHLVGAVGFDPLVVCLEFTPDRSELFAALCAWLYTRECSHNEELLFPDNLVINFRGCVHFMAAKCGLSGGSIRQIARDECSFCSVGFGRLMTRPQQIRSLGSHEAIMAQAAFRSHL